ncbi:MAG: hypothetical protein ACRECE_02075 [Xanthobacteraceae bacterium]
MNDKEERGEASASHVGTAHDRRRPGRRETTNPWLIRMMRGAVEPMIASRSAASRIDTVDALSAAKGIMLAVVVGLVLWLLLAFLAWHFLL